MVDQGNGNIGLNTQGFMSIAFGHICLPVEHSHADRNPQNIQVRVHLRAGHIIHFVSYLQTFVAPFHLDLIFKMLSFASS